MKKIKFIILIVLVGFVLYSLNYVRGSNENLEDIKKIKIGIHFKEVRKIMRNEPFKQDAYDFEPNEFVSLYEAPISASGDITITYSRKDSVVRRIYKGD